MSRLTPAQLIQAARRVLLSATPYFAPLLLLIRFEENQAEQTLSMNARGLLRYSPDYLAGRELPMVAALFLHEVMHLFLKHHSRIQGRDPALWNIAGDLAINGVVEACGLPLPKEGMFARDFGFPVGLTAEEYYERLLQEPTGQGGPATSGKNKLDEKEGKGKGGEGQGTTDGSSDSSDPRPSSKAACGSCGGCAGQPTRGEQETAASSESNEGGEEGPSEGDISRAVAAVAQEVQSSKNIGNVAALLRRMADLLQQAAQVPWRQKLRHVATRCCRRSPGAEHVDWSRPNRRTIALGIGPGRPIRPSYTDHIPRVMVAVDTSGSMSERDLSVALREMQGIFRALRAEVALVVCDARVHAVQEVRSIEQVLPLLQGGGGTDFRPVFAHAEGLRQRRPDVLVFATDGLGPAPALAPRGIQTIWLLVGQGERKAPASWGHEIRVT